MLAPIRPNPIIPSCIADSLSRKSLTWLTDEIPQIQNRLIAAVVFKAEHSHTSGLAEEHPPRSWRQAEPAGRNHPDDVTAGERQHIAPDAVYPREKAVRAGCHISRRLTVGTTIAVEFPAGPKRNVKLVVACSSTSPSPAFRPLSSRSCRATKSWGRPAAVAWVLDLPELLTAALVRMLAKDRNERFATPADVIAAIHPFTSGANLSGLMPVNLVS